MADELIDLVDENDNVVGTVWKSQAHRDLKLIHREIAIVVFNDRHEVLSQQRALSKKADPGIWGIAAAGHIPEGTEPQDSAARELYEKLGVGVKPVFYKKEFAEHKEKGQTLEARFFWIYYGLVKGRPKLRLDLEEVSDARWIDIDKLDDFIKDQKCPFSKSARNLIMELTEKLKV